MRTTEGIVVSKSDRNEAYYVWCKSTGTDAIVDYRYCPRGDVTGKWLKLVVDGPRACEPADIIEDRFETRVFKGLVEVKVDFEFDGRYNNSFAMFYNDYFGYICDPRYFVDCDNAEKGMWYSGWIVRHKQDGVNSRWRVSVQQDPVQQIERPMFNNGTNDLQVVEAIVHSESKKSDSYFAWSRSFPKMTLRIEFNFCPANVDVRGKWVKMQIDNNWRAQKMVCVLPDMFETRLNYGKTEVFVEFNHVNRCGQYEMFHHDYFGAICDSRFVVDNLVKGAWYSGWIIYEKCEETHARWHLSRGDRVEGPLRNRGQSDGDFRNDNLRPRSRSPDRFSNHGNQRQPRQNSPDRAVYRNRQRSRSLDYNRSMHGNNSSNFERSLSRSPERNRTQYSPDRFDDRSRNNDRDRNEDRGRNDDRGQNYNRPSYAPSYAPNNEEHRPFERAHSRERRRSPDRSIRRENRSPDRPSSSNRPPPSASPQRHQNDSIREHNNIPQYSPRSSVSRSATNRPPTTSADHKKVPSVRSSSPFSYRSSEQFDCSDDEFSRCAPVCDTVEKDDGNRTVVKEPWSPHKLVMRDVENSVETGSRSSARAASERTEEEKEIRRLRAELKRVCVLAATFTDDEEIRQQMRMHDYEQFEEFDEIIKKNI